MTELRPRACLAGSGVRIELLVFEDRAIFGIALADGVAGGLFGAAKEAIDMRELVIDDRAPDLIGTERLAGFFLLDAYVGGDAVG